MTGGYTAGPRGTMDRQVQARRLWSGGLATAVVAALIALVGVLIVRGVFDIPVLGRASENAWGDASTTRLMAGAAGAALLATGLVHLLLLSTPRAMPFFSWIVGLATLAATIAPFATDAGTDAKVATAVIHLVIGIAIATLVSGVARVSVTRVP